MQGEISARRIFQLRQHLRKHIDAFIAAYNETAKLFVWAKAKVYQKRLKARFADH